MVGIGLHGGQACAVAPRAQHLQQRGFALILHFAQQGGERFGDLGCGFRTGQHQRAVAEDWVGVTQECCQQGLRLFGLRLDQEAGRGEADMGRE